MDYGKVNDERGEKNKHTLPLPNIRITNILTRICLRCQIQAAFHQR